MPARRVHQNLVLRWVRDEAVYEVWRRLRELGLGDAGADEITDVVSCPGTDSLQARDHQLDGPQRGRAGTARRRWRSTIELTRRIHVKMSGCPNGCGQHHIANIGFYGASIKVGEHTIPAYIPHIGGAYEGGDVRYGQRLKARLPAKRVPEAVERWVRFYESERAEGEEFNAFVDRVGTPEFEARVKDLTMPIEFNLENMNYFVDWTKNAPFEVDPGRGRVRRLAFRAAAQPMTTAAPDLETASAEEVLAYGVEQLPPAADDGLLVPEGGVGPRPHAEPRSARTCAVFTIDTGVLFPETLETWKRFEDAVRASTSR